MKKCKQLNNQPILILIPIPIPILIKQTKQVLNGNKKVVNGVIQVKNQNQSNNNIISSKQLLANGILKTKKDFQEEKEVKEEKVDDVPELPHAQNKEKIKAGIFSISKFSEKLAKLKEKKKIEILASPSNQKNLTAELEIKESFDKTEKSNLNVANDNQEETDDHSEGKNLFNLKKVSEKDY